MPVGRSTKRLRWVLLLIGVAVVCLVAFTGYQAVKARDALQAVAADFEQLSGQLTSGDAAAARSTLGSAQAAAQEARANTRGPGWWLTSRLPGVGDDVSAIRTVADVVDVLSDEVLPPVVEASQTLKPDNLRPVNGRIDLDPITQVAPSVVAADAELQRQEERVQDLEPENLSTALADPVSQLQQKLGEAATLSERASYAVRLLPSMLGADGKRTYLLLFQNNAEIRTTGGIPGAFATITADNGRIQMGAQGDAAGIGRFDEPPMGLTEEELALFGEKIGLFAQNVNFTPQFPRTAQLAQAMLQATGGPKVDGVMSTDPVALSYMLRGTGAIDLPTGQRLTADNAVQLLLNEVYLRVPDPGLQNQFFAAAARKVFDAVSAGQGEPRQVLDGLTQAAGERRLLVWSDHPEEQELLSETKLGGTLPTERSSHPYVGVYFNDGTGAKMDYYLHYNVSVESLSCEADRQELRVSLRMRSDAPPNAAELPVSVIGPGFGAAPGATRTNVYLYAPIDGRITDVTIDGRETENSVADFSHMGHPVGALTLDLEPREQRTLTFDVVTGPDQPRQVDLRVTPGVHGTGIGDVDATACS